MQISILNGIYTDEAADFRTSYPRNLIPVPKEEGISKGYLRPAEGIVEFSTDGPGIDRGGFNWNGALYRVMGTKLVKFDISGNLTTLGDVGTGGQVTFDPSFDYLGVSSGGRLYYCTPTGVITQVSDPDLGTVIDFIWVDGYFMATDGTAIVVTDLNDPFAVNPLKYGSSEVDPDPVLGLLKLKNEPYALNRYTIEVFDNVGGNGFPFRRIDGAQIQKGPLGTYTACVFADTIAFLGSGRNEAPAIYLGLNSVTTKISTREIDTLLLEYSEAQLALSLLEARVDKGHQLLYVHLLDRTLVYDVNASRVLEEPIWFCLDSSLVGFSQYRAKNLIWCYEKWISGDPTVSGKLGYFSSDVGTQYGVTVGWDFGTTILYNKGNGAICHELELVSLTGRAALGADPVVWTSYSVDGETWSQERTCGAGRQGNRAKRIAWLGQGVFRNWRIQKFRGMSDCHASFARLEARIEPLAF